MTPRHVAVINRWIGDTAAYADYLDHERTVVSYVVGPFATGPVPPGTAEVIVLDQPGHLVLDDADAVTVRAALVELIARRGPIDSLVALHEGDLEVAAALRDELGIPGERPDAIAPFRDKLLMARTAAAAGIAVPPTELLTRALAAELTTGTPRPMILKPRRGTASNGVQLVTAGARARIDTPTDGTYIVQPFVDAPILHVDGWFDCEGLGAWTASRYVGTCLDFESRGVLGSVEIDDPHLARRIADFTTDLLRVLSPGRRRPFHAELFDRGAEGLCLLEIAARVGGAEIPQLWRDVHGLDLIAAAFAAQSIGAVHPGIARGGWLGADPGQAFAGWLLVPPNAARPCVVDTGEAGGAAYWRRIPAPGSVVPQVAGYERSAARFRFRGPTSADVEAQLSAELKALRFTATTQPEPEIHLLGTGARAYREYGLPAVARRGRITLRDINWPTWQTGWAGAFATVRRDQPVEISAPCDAVLTWDETLVEAAAELAERTGRPGIGVVAARKCRDKLRTRELLARCDGSSVRFEHVRDLTQAMSAAERLGYPVVLKPRTLAGSVGVVLVRSPAELAEAFAQASGARYPGLGEESGLLVEEYLVGPEISVDSAVQNGKCTVLNVARKQLGPPPCFEEVGHRVLPWRDEPWAADVVALVQSVHSTLGVGTGLTHAEVRLTKRGPRPVELNCRLGGDLIPLLGQLATGIDLVGVATDLALGREPDMAPCRDLVAGVDFVYPEQDGVVRRIDVSGAARVQHIERAVALAPPGTQLLLPPRGIVPRAVALVAVADTAAACDAALSAARAELVVEMEPLAVAAAGLRLLSQGSNAAAHEDAHGR